MWTVTDLEAKPRQDLQALAKARGIRANSKSSQIIDDLLTWARANHKDETKVDVDNKKTCECCKKQAHTHSCMSRHFHRLPSDHVHSGRARYLALQLPQELLYIPAPGFSRPRFSLHCT
jgi:hypothetical protein